MKKILFSLLAATALTACDNYDEAERWTEPQPIEMKKNVLVEDFTGQNCVNCPTAAAMLHDLLGTKMGPHIVAVSVHGGAMALDVDKNPMGLATTVGQDYNTHFGVQAWPSGMIDRTNGQGQVGTPCDFTSWTAAIVSQLQKDLIANLDATTTYTPDTRQLSVDVTASAAGEEGNLDSGMSITVWLTESHITGMQLMPDGSRNTTYEHNHVLREALSTPYGDNIMTGTRHNDGTVSLHYDYTIPTTYGRNKTTVVPENMTVVAFITRTSGEVLQVIDVPVVR